MSQAAKIVGHIELPAQPQGSRRPRTLASVLGAANNPEADRPVVQLKSGGHPAIASARVLPHMNLVEIVTVPDLSDGGKVRALRLPLNQPIVGWVKLPEVKLPEVKPAESAES